MSSQNRSPTDRRPGLWRRPARGARDRQICRRSTSRSFVEKWDELIDWEGRAKSEGQFFIDGAAVPVGKETVLDVAAGTGFHSVRLTQGRLQRHGPPTGRARMLGKAFANGQARGLVLKTVQADWRWLNRTSRANTIAIICLGNSFTHMA